MSFEESNKSLNNLIEYNLHYFYSKASSHNKFNYKANNSLKYVFTRDYDWPNTIFFANFEIGELEERIHRIKKQILQNKLPNSWTIGPLSNPNTLGFHIEQIGFKLVYHQTGMALALKDLKIHPNLQLKIQNVVCDEDIKTWTNCVSKVFSINVCLDLMKDFTLMEDIKLYIGLYKDKVVSTLLLCLSKNTAGLHAVTTLPEHRGRNFASTLSSKALLDAKNLGYKHAVLQASSMGFQIYNKLGFKPYCEFNSYELT